MFEKGRVVLSKSGRDKGYLLAVLQADGKTVLVCDGKERPIDRPKAKNIRHIEPTPFVLCEEDFTCDRHLRRALSGIKMKCNQEVF